MSDTKFTGKQIAIAIAIQFVASLVAGILIYHFTKPKEDEVPSTAKTASTPKTTVVVTTPEDTEV